MPRKSSSQWEFGELFADQDLRRVLTVSELTGNVRHLLEERIGTVWVRGEVSNLRVQSSGHAYFTLKDPGAQLSCVLFRGLATGNRALLDQGTLVMAQGELTVYEVRGQYQLVVRELEFQGAGALQVAFEKLKRELESKGYFSSERKRTLPRLPERIGLVTSATGAAIRDVTHVIQRRQPGLQIVLAACRVQGEGAGAAIAAAIEELNHWSQGQPQGRGLDLILVTRGGGSLEDLWAFNELTVAEAVFRSALPVVSAVGHETDFTISDFVADHRAATPSVAAEIITEGAHASRLVIQKSRHAIARAARLQVDAALDHVESVRRRLSRCRPLRRLQERMQYLDETRDRIGRKARAEFFARQREFAATLDRLLRIRPGLRIGQYRTSLESATGKLRRAFQVRLKSIQRRMQAARDQLRLLSPEQTLARGYSITTDTGGAVIRSSSRVKPGDMIHTRVAAGGFDSRVVGDKSRVRGTGSNSSWAR